MCVGVTGNQTWVNYLHWALSLAKSCWETNEKGNSWALCSFVFIWYFWSEVGFPGKETECMLVCRSSIEKSERSRISQRAKFGCSGITKRAQLTPQRCSEAEMALSSCHKLGWVSWILVPWNWWVLGYDLPWEGGLLWGQELSADAIPADNLAGNQGNKYFSL